jgi:hypothetical protein
MVHTITMEDSITETPIVTVDSETKTAVIRTTRGIRTVVDSETKTMVIRILREARVPKTTADSEIKAAADSGILKAADQNLPAADSETVQVAAKALVQADNRAAEAALDKTIINKETNS